ncbi:DNA-directed RNA polymerase subunit delta [Oceanobacillus luteolus]|uniref:Probable DNA-directed RNA polymerase subunit delta n=1 Tax=Oceanobacillus luteolus TaxID=1274358 RepID=A0ABW4HMG3_9BACI|nr:DNA-directed RNA polymerase subunit delta [Oceanobacillus luteolus]
MLGKYSQEELKKKSMLELASIILKDAKKALNFNEIYDQIAEIKEYTQEEKDERVAQFYTELNVDGSFMTIGSNIWGLKEWYPVEQADEQVTSVPKKRKKKKGDDDLDDDDLEFDEDLDLVELGEEEEELEELDVYDEDVFDEDLEDDEEEVLEVDLDVEDEDDEEKI